MTSAKPEQQSVERLQYAKPAMRSISLVADQVLGVGCKTLAPHDEGHSVEGCRIGEPCVDVGS